MNDPHDWQSLYPAGVARAFATLARTLPEELQAAEGDAADRVWLQGPHAEDVLSFADVARRARGVAAQLAELGPPGERLLIRLPNGPEFVAALHGAWAAGWIAVPVTPELPVASLATHLADAEPRAVACTDDVRAAFDDLPAVVHGRERGAVPAVGQSGADAAVLQYTSGTTGGLKAAVMSHANLAANAHQNDAWFGWTHRDVILGALPFCHTWGLSCVVNASLAARARVVVLAHFDADAVLEAVERERVSVAYGSATMFHRLLDAAGPRATRVFRSLRYVKAGAMLVGGDLAARWAAAVPGVPMLLGYGLTEASPEVCNNPPQAPRAGTVGIPLPGTELRVCDPAAPDVPVGGEGELQVRGPQVTSGYWRRPDATSAAFADGGWLRTGDLARFDEAGYVVIVDRLKDLIKFRGWSVVPGTVEAALRAHPDVADAVVVGAPHPVDGEVPVAFVCCRAGREPSDAELTEHLAARVTPWERPRRFVRIAEIPRNHVGKALRRVLRERAAAGEESG